MPLALPLLPTVSCAATEIEVTRFGAKGIGASFDDTNACQAAIDYIYKQGGGTLLFPATQNYYNLSRPLVLRPRVSVTSIGGRAKLKNLIPDAHGLARIFLPGNFHPDFTSRLPYVPLGAISSNTNYVSPVGGTAGFAIGDQVLVASTTVGQTGGFPLPKYAWINTIQDISSGQMLLRYPVDVSVDARIAILGKTPARDGIPIFFYSDGTVTNLDIEATSSWMSDSAMLNAQFRNLTVRSDRAIYGNTFQHCEWSDSEFHFHKQIGELSHNSLNVNVSNCHFIFDGANGTSNAGGISLQEYGRNLTFKDCQIDIPHQGLGGMLLNNSNTENVRYENLIANFFKFDGVLIRIGAEGDSEFNIFGNVYENCKFVGGQAARAVEINESGGQYAHDNAIVGCSFEGHFTAPDSIRISSTQNGFLFSGNDVSEGAMLVFPDASNATITGNNIPGGIKPSAKRQRAPEEDNMVLRNAK